MKLRIESRHTPARYKSYVVGFVLSVITTLIAYLFVVNHVWPMQMMVYLVMALAVIQLVVQIVFFLHIGRGSRLKLVTFVFALIVVLIIVIGSIWIMNNLNYNMMHLTPDQQRLYMQHNEGI